jgi:hypothetical protein
VLWLIGPDERIAGVVDDHTRAQKVSRSKADIQAIDVQVRLQESL